MERISFRQEIQRNKIKSFFLLLSIFLIFLAVGYLVSYAVNPALFFVIMAFSSIFSIGYIFIGFYNSDKLAIFSARAVPAGTEHRQFINSVESMSLAAGLPKPKCYVMQSDQINAFAAGRDPKNAVICVTTGALRKLNKQELEGVIAHEMGHIANYDIRFITIASVVVGLISVIAEIFLRSLWFSNNNDNKNNNVLIIIAAILVAILAPLIANLISLAISRKREFAADATAVKLTRYSPGLRSALQKIKLDHFPEQDKKRYAKAMAPMFISDPFKKKFMNLFSTHPDIDQRISALEKM
ncbi:MAG TPA: M48 family metallopeptidase [Candidatus Nanoarchaeia archaeon]|nr:M48 family metallopeptidase [Candidatus Nanoarchaeia archaeon]